MTPENYKKAWRKWNGRGKNGCIIQARMGSARLPGKVLMKLNKKPVLQHIVERLRECNKHLFNLIIIATTANKEDDVIEEFCKEHKVECFRGSENNVLKRYYECAKEYKLDGIIRITGDCPLVEPKIVEKTVKEFIESDADYVSNVIVRSYPKGLDVEVFSFDALKKAFNEAVSRYDLEHVTAFMYNNPDKFHLVNFLSEGKPNPDERLCIDTMEDFNRIDFILWKEESDRLYEVCEKGGMCVWEKVDEEEDLFHCKKCGKWK